MSTVSSELDGVFALDDVDSTEERDDAEGHHRKHCSTRTATKQEDNINRAK